MASNASALLEALPLAALHLRLGITEEQLTTKALTVPDFWTSQAHSTIRTQYGAVPFVPFQWQREWIGQKRDDWANLTWDTLPEFYAVTTEEMLLKSRDVGSSEICVRFFTWCMMRFGGNILITADKHDNAKNLISIARQYLTSLPNGERPTLLRDNETQLDLDSIGTIKALSRGSGRSERCRYRLDTERAFWEDVAEQEAAISGALVAGGYHARESTANGFNTYHAEWVDEANGYRKTFVGRNDNPTHDAQWWERKRTELAKQGRMVEQEYPATPAEAFVTSSNTVFEAEIVKQYLADSEPPRRTYQNGAASIWIEPVVARQYIAGADVAEGIDAGNGRLDYSHLAIYDWRTLRHVASLHGQWPTDVFAELIHAMCQSYGFPFLAVERNNSGLSVLTTLKQLDYPQQRLYWQGDIEADVRSTKPKPPQLGWRTTSKSKKLMEVDFSASLTAREIDSRDRRLWDQCLSYVYRGDGGTGAQSNCHDDIVMAHMIARQMHKHARFGAVPGLSIGMQWRS